MTNLKTQRRLAAEILKVGQDRVWIDPNRVDDVEVAITREEIRKLIHEGVIKPLKERGVSRARARVIHEKKRKGLRRGPGSKSGASKAKISKKEAWMNRVRALRKRLRELKANKIIPEDAYRDLYVMVKSDRFKSVADLERYLKAHDLWRKR
ncbi:MAG: 50S ribosomal protein L19e [Nitrososphaerota archaeon]|nr:50S ribosomal protein L19e [Candidatus Bathyarchaeota archaeon]MDW8023137.1 50S ribosomal protein L19e [Nitrososphaerota archaeon]